MWKEKTSALHKVYKVAKKFTLDFVQFRLLLIRSHVIRPDVAVYWKMWIYLHFSFRLFMTDDVLFIKLRLNTTFIHFPPKQRLLFTKQLTRYALYGHPNKDPSVSTSNVKKQIFLPSKQKFGITMHTIYSTQNPQYVWVEFHLKT